MYTDPKTSPTTQEPTYTDQLTSSATQEHNQNYHIHHLQHSRIHTQTLKQ